MKKNNIIKIVIASTFILTLTGTSIFASQEQPLEKDRITQEQKSLIKNAFDSLQTQNVTNSLIAEKPLVDSKNFKIYSSDFNFYKKNVDLLQELNNISNTQGVTANVSNDTYLTDTILIKQLIKEKLAIEYAKKIKIFVTDQELNNIIEKEKKALYDVNVEGQNKELVQELMSNRIRITGLTEEEFWKSEKTKQQYSDSIYLSKLYNTLYQKGEIKDTEDFDKFQDNLLNKNINEYKINQNLLH